MITVPYGGEQAAGEHIVRSLLDRLSTSDATVTVMGMCGSCPGADKGCWAPDCYIDPDTRKK